MRLFWKLFCSMVCITTLACSLTGFWLIDGQFRAALDQEVAELYKEDYMLHYVLSLEAEGRPLSGREELSQLAKGVPPTTCFQLSDGAGELLGVGDSLLWDSPAPANWLADNQRGWRLERVGEDTFILHGASALTLLGETVWLETCRDVTYLFAQRDAQYRSFFYVMLALVAGTAALSLLVAHLVLRPLTRLSDATRHMAQGELDRRVSVTSGDELGRLSADFNVMAGQIEGQMEALADAARREKDFTASFAHEIKTPLTSIIGYADLLLSRPVTGAQVRESAGYIFREGRRLEALSRKLMELVVLDRQDFPLRPIAMDSFLLRVGNILRPAIEQAGLDLKVEAEQAVVPLEPDLMETVCLNLLDNARKATQPGGHILLLGRSVAEGYLIQVKDTGKGIPEEELSRITEPFYMVDKSRARAQGGAGLGLSLCRRIVELHDGTLAFESTAGQGTTVRVCLKGGVQA